MAAVIGIGIICCFGTWYCLSTPGSQIALRIRRRFSPMPLGLGRPRKLAHGILDVRDFKNVDDYCNSLKRGPRRTMQKQIDKTFKEHGISVATRCSAAWLSREHLEVAIAHQSRLVNPTRAIIAGTMRFFVACLMDGIVDEFRDSEGRLIAWCQVVAKGTVMRAMWYYADPVADKYCIWFSSVRLCVARTLAAKCDHCDLGPSRSEKVKDLKAVYGFTSRNDWDDHCDYTGEFKDLTRLVLH